MADSKQHSAEQFNAAIREAFEAWSKEQRLRDAARDMLAALKKADQFIRNGIELGYIQMPDASTPDSAHDTPPMIRAAIAKAEGWS